ncbi:MAG: hypothetical protein OHK0046_08360 [Anaerolineae bacterium]
MIDRADIDEWVIFPEGMISGYAPEDPDYIRKLNKEALFSAISSIQYRAMQRKCHCIIGTALPADPVMNAALHINAVTSEQTYYKVNLDALDRQHFTPGTALHIFTMKEGRFGIQMGSELLFPEQWKALKHNGAALILHLNNTLEPADRVWGHAIITRALETQSFVCSVNTAESRALSSYLVSPAGDVLLEAPPGEERLLSTNIDLSQARTDLLQMERTDLVKLIY